MGRSASFRTAAQPPIADAVARARLHWTLAQLGVAIFAIALLVPTIVDDAARATGSVLVADLSERDGVARPEAALPNEVAERPRRVVAATPAATAVPAPTPVVLVAGGPGVVVTASWYGPGLYENRLPCWQWLAAQGQAIQFLPDTWGVAHKTLPCGTLVELTHGANTVRVPVVDRGPYIPGREIDLSPAVKAALACSDLCTMVMRIP